MNQDLQQYADIIEQLKPMVNEPEFNRVLMQVGANIPKEKRFLIKMEVKRLAKPCMRSIDLRGLVDGKCKLYEHDGRKHYMDDVAIEKFEEQIRVFGSYTFGVYEAVQNTENNFRVLREKAEKRELSGGSAAEKKKASNVFHYTFIMLELDHRRKKVCMTTSGPKKQNACIHGNSKVETV